MISLLVNFFLLSFFCSSVATVDGSGHFFNLFRLGTDEIRNDSDFNKFFFTISDEQNINSFVDYLESKELQKNEELFFPFFNISKNTVKVKRLYDAINSYKKQAQEIKNFWNSDANEISYTYNKIINDYKEILFDDSIKLDCFDISFKEEIKNFYLKRSHDICSSIYWKLGKTDYSQSLQQYYIPLSPLQSFTNHIEDRSAESSINNITTLTHESYKLNTLFNNKIHFKDNIKQYAMQQKNFFIVNIIEKNKNLSLANIYLLSKFLYTHKKSFDLKIDIDFSKIINRYEEFIRRDSDVIFNDILKKNDLFNFNVSELDTILSSDQNQFCDTQADLIVSLAYIVQPLILSAGHQALIHKNKNNNKYSIVNRDVYSLSQKKNNENNKKNNTEKGAISFKNITNASQYHSENIITPLPKVKNVKNTFIFGSTLGGKSYSTEAIINHSIALYHIQPGISLSEKVSVVENNPYKKIFLPISLSFEERKNDIRGIARMIKSRNLSMGATSIAPFVVINNIMQKINEKEKLQDLTFICCIDEAFNGWSQDKNNGNDSSNPEAHDYVFNIFNTMIEHKQIEIIMNTNIKNIKEYIHYLMGDCCLLKEENRGSFYEIYKAARVEDANKKTQRIFEKYQWNRHLGNSLLRHLLRRSPEKTDYGRPMSDIYKKILSKTVAQSDNLKIIESSLKDGNIEDTIHIGFFGCTLEELCNLLR